MTPSCPYCRAPFEEDDQPVVCPACGTAHHGDCLAENGGCTVFGCSEAPVDEPKISVSPQDMTHAVAASPPPAGPRVPVPPPPPRAGIMPPPPRPEVHRFRTSQPASERILNFGGYAPAAFPAQPFGLADPYAYVARKTRVTYVLLAVFFGIFGVHNFYAGYIKKAVIQLCLTLFTCFYASPLVFLWAIIEACITKEDDDGVGFI